MKNDILYRFLTDVANGFGTDVYDNYIDHLFRAYRENGPSVESEFQIQDELNDEELIITTFLNVAHVDKSRVYTLHLLESVFNDDFIISIVLPATVPTGVGIGIGADALSAGYVGSHSDAEEIPTNVTIH